MAIQVKVKDINDASIEETKLLIEPQDLNDRINEVVPGIVKGITLAVETNLLNPESVISNNITDKIENYTTEKLEDFDTRITTLEEDITDKATIKDLDDLKAEIDTDVQYVTDMLNGYPEQGTPEDEDYKEGYEGLIAIAENLQAKVVTHEGSISEHAGKIASNSSAIEQHTASIGQLSSNLESHITESSNFNDRLTDLESFRTNFDDNVTKSVESHTKELSVVSGKVATLETAITSVNNDLATVQGSISDIASDIETINTNVEGVQSSIDSMSTDIADIKTTIQNGVDSNVYQRDTFDDLNSIDKATLLGGDIGIVKTLVHGTTYSHTSYVYDKENQRWEAMDGNYNASNVYFDKNIEITKDIGYITVDGSGFGEIPAAGKNLVEIFETMFSQDTEPTVTSPSISISIKTSDKKAVKNAYEVGTELSGLTYSISFNSGNYSFGPSPTGVTIDGDWTISDSNGDSYSSTSGNLDSLVITDDTSFALTAEVAHTAGKTPLTKKGKDCAAKKIGAGTATKTSTAITGYRRLFMGVLDSVIADTDIDSNIIRNSLDTENGASGAAALGAYVVTANAGDAAIYWAYPTALTSKKPVFTFEDGKDIWVEFSGVEFLGDAIDVCGAAADTEVPYTVYKYAPTGGKFKSVFKTKITLQ